MRCFIGLALPREAREILAAALSPMRAAKRNLIWTARENYHLTLAFLGELEGDAIDKAAAALDGAMGFGDIRFSFNGFGGFPFRGAWRILYARLADQGRSAALCRAIKETLGALVKPDHEGGRVFTPHVTLARVRGKGDPERLQWLRYDLPRGTWMLGRCSLYKSLLLRWGPVYTELRGVDLAPRR